MIPEFRAWDKCKKIMITDYHIPYYDDVYGVLLNDVFYDDHVVFEQYTGLKDVNGNKIFEGDIVEVIFQYWGKLGNRYEVNFKKGAFTVKHSLLSEIQPCISVIGNIHENPELLEVE